MENDSVITFITAVSYTHLDKIFIQNREFKNLMITVLSFGFKYGIPSDADLVFDVRFLPNPYYYENLRKLTGNDQEIQDFVMGYDMAHVFLDKLILTFQHIVRHQEQ